MVGSRPPPLPRSLPSWSCPRWAPSANTESSASGPQKPRTRASIAPGEGWCVLQQGTPNTHTFPQPGPVLQPATSSRQPSHRCTGSGWKWVCSGTPRGQWLTALLPVAHLPTFPLLVLPSSKAQAVSVGQLAARQPTVNPLSSAAQRPGADHGGPIHVRLPTEHGAESFLLFSPHPALLGPKVTAPGFPAPRPAWEMDARGQEVPWCWGAPEGQECSSSLV